MNMIKMNSFVIFDGTESKVIEINQDEQIKIQGVGSGTYTIKGRLSSDCEWDTVCAIKASDFSKGTAISDTNIWIADVSGYSHITVEASGFTKIYATTIG